MIILKLMFFLTVLSTVSFAQINSSQVNFSGKINVNTQPFTTFDMTNPGNYYDITGSVIQSGYLQSNVYSRGIFSSTSTTMTVNGYTNTSPGTGIGIGVRLNGADDTFLSFTNTGNQSFQVILPSGTNTVELITGFQGQSTPTSSPLFGEWVNSVTFMGDSHSVKSPPTETTAVVIYGDSIMVGAGTQQPSLQSWPMLIRDHLAGTGTSITYGWGSLALFPACQDSTSCQNLANILTGGLTGIANKYVYLQPSTNDYAFGTCTASTFQTQYSLLLSDIHANDPTIHIYAQTATTRASETNNNGLGNNLPQYRTAITNACTAVSSYCTVEDGTTILSFPTDFNGDGIHPLPTVQGKYATFVETALGI